MSICLIFLSVFLVACGASTAKSDVINVDTTNFKNKQIYTFGDSITWYDGNEYTENHLESSDKAIGFQSYLRGELSANVENFGISGETLVGISKKIKEGKYKNVDYVLLSGGVNDWFKEVPLGEIESIESDFDTDTSFGALQSGIEFIQSESNAKIILITPIPGKFKKESKEVLAGKELPDAYQKMYMEIGDLYNLPVVDWYKETKFEDDFSKWYRDKPGTVLGDRYIHVGNEGYEVMAKILIESLVKEAR